MDGKINICDEISQNFLDSSWEVNCNRAFPNIKDGLKMGQRACLWEMFVKKYTSNKPHVKSAKVSGGVIADLWPHGDTAIYETFARMSQSFINNIPEVDWHGANGNVILGGDALAHQRYTECRLAPIVEQGMLQGIKKNNVPMIPNFSEDLEWPLVFPAIFPRLLVNGAQGIGVSISNVWLPHNFTETAHLILDYIESGELKEDTYYPDFPTGGTIINQDDLAKINKTGRGKVIIESKYKINNQEIDFYELPYQVYIEPVIDEIKKAIDENKIQGIKDIFNKSDKKKISLVVECETGFTPEKVVQYLFTETNLRKQYNANQNGIISKTPVMITLKKYVDTYLEHNKECIQKEFQFDFNAAVARIEILEGLTKALEDIDNIIQLIKKSPSAADAKKKLIEKYNFTQPQVDAILNMKLSRLANMEKLEVENELQEKKDFALKCKEVINSSKRQEEILVERLRELVKKFGDERRTDVTQKTIAKKSTSGKVKEVIIEDVMITYSDAGYIQNIPIKSYRTSTTYKNTFKCQTNDMILLFSSLGKLYRLKVDTIKQCSQKDKGTAVGALLNLDPGEKILNIFSMNINEKHPYIVGVTKFGQVKKSEKLIYLGSTQNKNGLQAAGLKDNDSYIGFWECNGDYMSLITKNDMIIQFELEKINPVGKTAKGVKGIALSADDYVVEAIVCNPAIDTIKIKKYNKTIKGIIVQGRGGKGRKIV